MNPNDSQQASNLQIQINDTKRQIEKIGGVVTAMRATRERGGLPGDTIPAGMYPGAPMSYASFVSARDAEIAALVSTLNTLRSQLQALGANYSIGF